MTETDTSKLLIDALSKLQSDFLLSGNSSEAFDSLLNTLLEVTESEYGFIGEVHFTDENTPYLKTHAITDISWNEETSKFYEENAPKGLEFYNLESLFGNVMKTGDAVITNQPAADPRAAGIPDGHPPLNAFMGLPINLGEKMLGMIGVANRKDGYDEATVGLLLPLLTTCASLIQYFRNEQSRIATLNKVESREKYFREVLQSALDAVVVTDEEGIVKEWNSIASSIFGWSRDEVLGRSLDLLIVPESLRNAHREGMKRYLATRESNLVGKRREVDALNKQGKTFPVEISIASHEDESGVFFSSFIRDISQRKKWENDLGTATTRLSELIKNIHAALLVEDENRRVVLANDELCSIFNIPVNPNDLIGQDCRQAAIDIAGLFSQPQSFIERVSSLVENRKLIAGDVLELKDGRFLERDYIPIYIDEDYKGHMWLYRDITQQKSYEKSLLESSTELQHANIQLERANKLKDEFLASMSHELRTPLHTILGLSEAIRIGVHGDTNDKQVEMLSMLEESGHHLLDLINSILDLSKIEAGRLELNYGSVDIQNLCEQCIRFIREDAYKKNIKVSTSINLLKEHIDADPMRLKQVFVNLLNNAVKFTPNGGMLGIDISEDSENNSIQFIIWDNGIGIESSDMKKLFKPFVQLDSSLTRTHPGTGLGLSLVSKLVQLHGGGIEVKSTPGQGSQFIVTLPLYLEKDQVHDLSKNKFQTEQQSQEYVGVTSQVDTSGEGITILLVEDEEININVVEKYLEIQGYKLHIAKNGKEAIEKTHEVMPDIILMDIQMPVMDGIEATRKIKNTPKVTHIPIVALTALAMPGDRDRCIAAGAVEYLSKPISLDTLHEHIQKIVHEHSYVEHNH